ncbi:MAG: ABC transporter permease subunit [Thermoproteota archaeon]|nr:ABC transporter permease subunit [Thermoproteota archaeon]
MDIKSQRFNIIIVILSGAAVVYIAYPFISVLTFIEPSTLMESLTRPQVADAFNLSLICSTISTLLLVFFGMPLAYCFARYTFRGKFLLKVIVIFPLVLPPLASGALLLGVFGPSSNIGVAFSSIEFTQSPIGIIIAQTYVASPFMILASQSTFESVDESYEKVARVLGKSRFETFIQVTLPLARPGLIIAILLTWVRAIGELGATMMMSYNPHTVSIQIFEDNAIGGLRQAMPDIILVIILSIIALVVVSTIKKRNDSNLKIGWS